ARELRNSCDISGEFASEIFPDEFPGRVKIASAGVIAEPLPGVEDIRFLGPGERGKIRETIEPALIVRNDSRDLGLLEHEFRDQDRVWIAGSAPREVSAP